MLSMLFPVVDICFGKVLLFDDEKILGIVVFSSLGEIKAARDDRCIVDDHDLVVRYGMLFVNVSRYLHIG